MCERPPAARFAGGSPPLQGGERKFVPLVKGDGREEAGVAHTEIHRQATSQTFYKKVVSTCIFRPVPSVLYSRGVHKKSRSQ